MLEGLLDVWLIGYVVAAAGITELVMRFTPEGFTRRRWGALVCIGTALLASALDGSARGIGWQTIGYRALIAAALASGGYGWVKSVLPKGFGGGSPQ